MAGPQSGQSERSAYGGYGARCAHHARGRDDVSTRGLRCGRADSPGRRLLHPACREMDCSSRAHCTGGGALQVLITTSELVVGQNRFAFGLLQHNKLLDAATVAVRVYDIRDQQAQLTAETPALYHTLEVVEQGNRVHVHPDGTRHVHSETTDVQGIYVTQVTFARPGPWGLEILAQHGDGPVETARLRLNVLEVSPHRYWVRQHRVAATSSPVRSATCARLIRANRRIHGCIRPVLPMRSRRVNHR